MFWEEWGVSLQLAEWGGPWGEEVIEKGLVDRGGGAGVRERGEPRDFSG